MIRFLVKFLFLFNSLVTLSLYASSNSGDHSLERQFLSSGQNLDVNGSDLSLIVGLPFAWSEKDAFQIHGKNSAGEAVGIAYFKKDQYGSYIEIIAWHWYPGYGFQIITSKSELIQAYGKGDKKVPFQFYRLIINDCGVVAGSFLIDQPYRNFNQYPWFWWSSESGLHLSALPSTSEILKKINDIGFVLLEHVTSTNFALTIKNVNDPDYSKVICFQSTKLNSIMLEILKPLFLQVHYLCGANIRLKLHWYPICANYFDENLKIVGEGTCIASFSNFHPVVHNQIEQWHLRIGYEIEDGIMRIYIKELGSPRPVPYDNILYEEAI